MASMLPEFDTPNSKAILALIDQLALLFGYYTNRIDLKTGDLAAVCLPDCTLTAHAPLWGTKPGKEKGVPALQVRKTLGGSLLPFVRIARHDMQLAMHPEGKGICLFFEVFMKLKVCPCFGNLMKVPLLFVVNVANDTAGVLRISSIHEWPAKDTAEGRTLLIEKVGWPAETKFTPYVAFGAES